MTQSATHLFTNWTDGMKIKASDFINEHNAILSQLSSGIGSRLNVYNYGLLACNGKSSNEAFVFLDNQQQVQVRLQKFSAITFGGHVVDLDETEALSSSNLKAVIPDLRVPFEDLKGKSAEYFIVLVINPYVRVPYGSIDPQEIPLRHPHIIPEYKLELIPANEATENVLGGFHLPVGKLKVQEQKVVCDDEYIPPCCFISSHKHLLKLHAVIEQFLGKMQLHSVQIIQKILQKKTQNDLAMIVQKVCEQISVFTSINISSCKNINLYQPPVILINIISSFASLLKNTFDMYAGSGKEKFMDYCAEEWCNISQNQLESAVTPLANHQYNHLNINDAVVKVLRFTEAFTLLFAKLANLEYIGKRNERFYVTSSIVSDSLVKEQMITAAPEPQPKKRNSFLAE